MGEWRFDVFLSYNSAERPAVERIARKLRAEGLEPWWDRWDLPPASSWQDEIALALCASRACAVIVGATGLGDWAREEMAVAQNRAVEDHSFRLFMVLLPGAPELSHPSLAFLRTRTWVDLRAGLVDSDGVRDLIAAITGVPWRRPVAIATTDSCPYRGLAAFEEEHAEWFVGREDDVSVVVEKLRSTRFLAVLGPSGSGMSSLLRAGLVPAVKRGVLPGSDDWTVCTFTPRARPLTTMAAQLTRIVPGTAMQSTLERLRVDPRSLDLAAVLALADRSPECRLMLVIDQFEELFTLCADEEERRGFLANLVYAATIPAGPVVVVLGMRADFYHRCAAYADLRTLVADEQFLVGPLGNDGIRRTVEEPAWRAGLELETGLVETIMVDIGERSGTLPLPEYVLLELWLRRRGTMGQVQRHDGRRPCVNHDCLLVGGGEAQRRPSHGDAPGRQERERWDVGRTLEVVVQDDPDPHCRITGLRAASEVADSLRSYKGARPASGSMTSVAAAAGGSGEAG